MDNEPLTCLAFRQGNNEPDEANLYLRLPGNAHSDAEATERISALMVAEGIDPQPYSELIDTIAPAPLETISGVQELLSYRTISRGQPADIGLYLRFSPYNTPAAGPL